MKLPALFGLLSLSIGLDLVTCRSLTFDGIELGQHQNEISEATKLIPHFEKLEKELLENGADGQRPETFTKLAKEILDKLDQSSSALCLVDAKLKKKYRKALVLFISLEETVGRCNFESYKILAKNFIASKQYSSILSTVDAYYRIHATTCSAYYKKQYHQLVGTIDDRTLDSIGHIIEKVQIDEFFPKRSRIPLSINLLTFDELKFTEDVSAIDMLANRVAEQIKEHPISTGGLVSLYDVLEEYLYRPCKVYRNKLANVLTPARFDGKIRHDEQEEFIDGDEEFKQAMINNRVCGALLNDQYKLYGPLYKKFKKLMNLVGAMVVPSR